MLICYFRRPSRIEQLRSSTGGHLLEGFAKELSQGYNFSIWQSDF